MELKEKVDENSNNSLDIFLEEFKTRLDKFKEIKIRFNNSIFMTKSLRKATMLSSRRSLIITNPRKTLKNTNSKEIIV